MAVVVLLVLVALAFAEAGLFIASLKWALIVAVALLIAGAVTGRRLRRTRS